MAICIPKKYVDKIKQIVTSERDSAVRLQKMTDVFDGNRELANDINLLYEKKLLLKQQDKALDRFISDIDGVSAIKKAELRKKYIANKARKEQLIGDLELNAIVKDIYDRKYGLDIDENVIKDIAKLRADTNDLAKKAEGTASHSQARMDEARKLLEIGDITKNIVNPGSDKGFFGVIGQDLKERGARIKAEEGIIKVVQTGKEIFDIATSPGLKVFKAAWDASYLGRQGRKVARADLDSFLKANKQANKIWKNITSKADQEKVFREWQVWQMSDDIYNLANKSGLAVGILEEEAQGVIAEKIGLGVGSVFNASDKSFTTFVQTTRLSMFKKYLNAEKARLGGTMPDQAWLKEMAEMVNSFSGKGKWSKFGSGNKANRLAFSANYVKSQLDTFTKPFTTGISSSVRKQYRVNSAKTFAEIAGIMALAGLVTEVGWDPRSSTFGKVKIPGSKSTWVDVSAGLGSYLTLMSRIVTKSYKSATSGKVTELNTGKYGSRNLLDVMVDFGYNKLAPGTRALADYILKGVNFDGEKPTFGNTLPGLATPISVETAIELWQNEDFLTFLIGTMAEVSGLGSQTYRKR